jgi:hypothetical protein
MVGNDPVGRWDWRGNDCICCSVRIEFEGESEKVQRKFKLRKKRKVGIKKALDNVVVRIGHDIRLIFEIKGNWKDCKYTLDEEGHAHKGKERQGISQTIALNDHIDTPPTKTKDGKTRVVITDALGIYLTADELKNGLMIGYVLTKYQITCEGTDGKKLTKPRPFSNNREFFFNEDNTDKGNNARK